MSIEFDLLLMSYERYVFTIVKDYVAPDDVDDIVQEVFLHAYQALKRYSPERLRTLMLRPWLRKIALNASYNYLHRKRWFGLVFLSLEMAEADGWQMGDDFENPELIWIRGEFGSEITRLLQSLPRRDFQLLTRHFLYDMTYAEMAREMNCSEGTVRSRACRALNYIRCSLKSKFGQVELSELTKE